MLRIPLDKCREAVEHLLVDVMQLEPDNGVMKVLEINIGSPTQVCIYKLTQMPEDQFYDLKYKSDKGGLQGIPKCILTRLVTFNHLYWYRTHMENNPMKDDLLTITSDDFKEFEHWLTLQQMADLVDPNKPDALPPPVYLTKVGLVEIHVGGSLLLLHL